jgi:hypothetical protein
VRHARKHDELAIAVRKLGRRQHVGHRGVGRPGLVAREDASNHLAVARPPIVRPIEVELLGAIGQRG